MKNATFKSNQNIFTLLLIAHITIAATIFAVTCTSEQPIPCTGVAVGDLVSETWDKADSGVSSWLHSVETISSVGYTDTCWWDYSSGTSAGMTTSSATPCFSDTSIDRTLYGPGGTNTPPVNTWTDTDSHETATQTRMCTGQCPSGS